MKTKQNRLMVYPSKWALDALRSQIKKQNPDNWREIANKIFDAGVLALGYVQREDSEIKLGVGSEPQP